MAIVITKPSSMAIQRLSVIFLRERSSEPPAILRRPSDMTFMPKRKKASPPISRITSMRISPIFFI